VDEATQRKLLRLVGLGVRGRLAVVGVNQVRDAAQRGKLRLAVVAPDASENSLDKVVPLLRAKHIDIIEGPTSAELGASVGREATTVIGVTDVPLARGIRDLMKAGSEGASRRTP
jgi:ribosomal protein L7Ae-like RNA K-turn-binding protein